MTFAQSFPIDPPTRRGSLMWIAGAIAACSATASEAATATELTEQSRSTLDKLYQAKPQFREFGQKSRAILVFPSIVKAGAIIGGQGGDGALLRNGNAVGFFRIAAGSVGFQLGAQTFSYVMFFMTQHAIDYAKSAKGWAFGSGPSVVVVDAGFAKNMNTTTLKKDIVAVAFGQHGLMAGMGLEGSKISRIHPKV